MTSSDLPVDKIHFHSKDIDFSLPDADIALLAQWIGDTISAEGHSLNNVTYIFCSDAYLYQINVSFLNHDTYTDIITFPYAEDTIEADIFISIDRIIANAATYQVSFDQELYRVMIHGILHLCGYHDKKEVEKKLMRLKEDLYLTKLNHLLVNNQ